MRRALAMMGLGIAAVGLLACDQVNQLLNGSSAPTATAMASASAVVPEGDWKATKDFDGKWRVAASTGFRDGGYAFHPLLGMPVVIEGGVMAFLSNASGQQTQIRKTLRVAGGSDGAQRVFLQHRGTFYDHDAMDASAESVDATSDGWSRHGLIRNKDGNVELAIGPVEGPAPSFSEGVEGRELVRLIPFVEEEAVAAEELVEAPPTMPTDATITFETTGPCAEEVCPEYTVVIGGDGQMTVSGKDVGEEPRESRLPVSTARAIWSQLRIDEFFTRTEMPERPEGSRDGKLVVEWGEGSSRSLDAALFPKARAIADKLANVK